MTLLEIDDISKRFGGVAALRRVGFDLAPGGAVGLIGPNGSGKTTLMNVLSGVYAPDSGAVTLEGMSVVGLPPYELVARGMARTFQATRVFETVTVYQNMMVPVLHQGGDEWPERALGLLERVELSDFVDQPASELSGGQQRLLEFARAMMTRPRVVLMDEPFAGVHPEIKEQLISSVAKMRDDGTAFVVVSHEIPVITRVADELVCLADGEVISKGAAAEVTDDPRVVDAYIGHRRHR